MTDLDHEPGSETPGQQVPFRVLVATVPVAMGLVDLELQALTFVNARWRELTGVDLPTPIPFSALTACLHPDDIDVAMAAFAEAADAGAAFTTEARLVHPNGAVRHVRLECAPVTDDRGKVRAFTGAMLDITALVEATESRRRSEQRYRHLVQDAPVGQIVAEVDGTLVEINNAFVRMMGSTRTRCSHESRAISSTPTTSRCWHASSTVS